MISLGRFADTIGARLAAIPSRSLRLAFLRSAFARDPQSFAEVLGPRLNREPSLDATDFDLEPGIPPEFEELAPLFASNSLNHGLIGMTIRQAAYLHGLARRMGATRAIEIGRFRGGSTIVLASAMGRDGTLWSVDLGEKEERFGRTGVRPNDEQIADFCARHGLEVHLLVGDSRSIEVDTPPVDIVLIDGDHSYDGVRSDFERFGRRARVGGAVLFDDAFDDGVFPSHEDTIGSFVQEVAADPHWKLVRAVDRLAHFERVSPDD